MPNSSYDWDAFNRGNLIQKWWKRKVFYLVLEAIRQSHAQVLNPIVDVGCGSSPMLRLIKAEDKTGVDIDPTKIDFIEEMDKSSTYICKPGEATGLKSNSYSAVLCIEVIEHHEYPYELVQELARLAKPDGTVIIATPDFASLRWKLIEYVYGIVMRKGYHEEHIMQFTESALVMVCRMYGLKHMWTRKIFGADMVCKFKKMSNA